MKEEIFFEHERPSLTLVELQQELERRFRLG